MEANEEITFTNIILETPNKRMTNLTLREAIPLCEQNRYRKIRRTQQKVIYCFTMQLVSTQLWGHHQVVISN
jgi:hypothetical protein